MHALFLLPENKEVRLTFDGAEKGCGGELALETQALLRECPCASREGTRTSPRIQSRAGCFRKSAGLCFENASARASGRRETAQRMTAGGGRTGAPATSSEAQRVTARAQPGRRICSSSSLSHFLCGFAPPRASRGASRSKRLGC